MRLSELETTLRRQAEEEQATAARARRWQPRELLRALRPKASKPAEPRKRGRRDDFIIAGLGVALGLGCAVFPWYIFMNPEKFGVRAMEFEGNSNYEAPIELGSSGERIGAPMSPNQIPPMKLDLFATGTVTSDEPGETPHQIVDQPFPGEPAVYRMVYAATGRAMIADDTGLWVVQRGSVLPDNSKVASIEQRKGRWVLVTSDEKVLELSKL